MTYSEKQAVLDLLAKKENWRAVYIEGQWLWSFVPTSSGLVMEAGMTTDPWELFQDSTQNSG